MSPSQSPSHIRPRSASFLRSTGVISPIYSAATTSRPFTSESPDMVIFRQIRADRLASLRHLMPLGGKSIPEVKERDVWVPVRDGGEVRVRVYEPAGEDDKGGEGTGGRPLILMFHEGGFVFGDLTDEEMNCRLFVRELGAVCGNVEYRLAPEHPFPTCTEDSWDVTRWFAQNAAAVGADLKKGFIVGGASAGGAITGVLSQLSRMEGLEPPITGQYLAVPVIFPPGEVPEKYKDEFLSPWENNSDPILKGHDHLVEHVKNLNIDTTSPMYTAITSPGYPPSASSTTRKMPPAYIQIAGIDPLRDHGLIYDRILREEYGVQTKVDMYSGFGHMFWTNWPEMKESHEFVGDTIRGMRWLLEQNGNVMGQGEGSEDFTLR